MKEDKNFFDYICFIIQKNRDMVMIDLDIGGLAAYLNFEREIAK